MSTESTLEQDLAELREQMARAKQHGIRGHNLAQRLEDDLKRIINSGWLTLSEFADDRERDAKIQDS